MARQGFGFWMVVKYVKLCDQGRITINEQYHVMVLDDEEARSAMATLIAQHWTLWDSVKLLFTKKTDIERTREVCILNAKGN